MILCSALLYVRTYVRKNTRSELAEAAGVAAALRDVLKAFKNRPTSLRARN